MYFPRVIRTQLTEALKYFPVVLLTGARQVGKSTLALDLLENYITLDDINVYSSLQADPQAFIGSLLKPIAIDEIQKEPSVLSAIKLDVDRKRINGSYLLTGSANILAYKDIVDTLAGRIAVLELLPLSCREMANKTDNPLDLLFSDRMSDGIIPPVKSEQIISHVLSGGYPEIKNMESAIGRYRWFSSYIRTYIERDVRDIGELRNLDKFIRMYGMLSSRSGNLLNKLDISRDAGINIKTLDNYLELLKLVYQVEILQPYSANIDKRLSKTGKLFFTDSGILAHMLGITSENGLTASSHKGSIFETFIFSELLKAVTYSEKPARLSYFRTADGKEIDFIVERGGSIVAVEVKMAQSVRQEDFKQIAYLQSQVGNFHAGYVLYLGEKLLPFGDKMYGLPASILF